MYDPRTRASLIRLASTLPAGSVAHTSLMAHLKVADMGFDIWARTQILAGAFKVSPSHLRGGRPLAHLQDLAGRLPPEARAEWVNNRKDYKLYEKLEKGVSQTIRDKDQAAEVANNLVAGLTLSGSETDNLFYQLGRSKKNEIEAGKYLPEAAASDTFYNARRRAKDAFKKKDVLRDSDSFDGGDGEDDEGGSFAEMLSQSGPMELVGLLFDSPRGNRILQRLDGLVDFSGAEQQRAVWDALKEDVGLLDSNVGLARAYLERTGRTITPQGAGQLKNKVLARLAQTLQNNPKLMGEVEMLSELSTLRRASKKKRIAALLREADRAVATVKHHPVAPSRKTASEHPLGRMAIVYFDLAMEDYNIEEDADNGDEFAQSLLDDPRKALKLESDALKSLSRMFGARIMDEGHDSGGGLVCKFSVDSWADVKKANDVINRHHEGGDDQIGLDVPYMVARDFRLYPDGVNDVFYGSAPGAEGDLDEWLSEHK